MLLVERLGKLFGNNEKSLDYEKERKFSRKRMLPIQHKISLAMNVENKYT